MTNRYRWYRARLPDAGESLADIIRRAGGKESLGTWFTSIRSQGEREEFRFFWETDLIVLRVSESGAESREVVKSTQSVELCISVIGKYSLIRIADPGRNTGVLAVTLEQLVGYGFTWEPVSFEKRAPLSILSSVDDVKLVGLKLCNVLVGDGVVARMEFASKLGISEESLEAIKGMAHRRNHATYDLVYRGIRGHLAYSASGAVRVGGALAPRILAAVEEDLERNLLN